LWPSQLLDARQCQLELFGDPLISFNERIIKKGLPESFADHAMFNVSMKKSHSHVDVNI
jgi:hypothetical protein